MERQRSYWERHRSLEARSAALPDACEILIVGAGFAGSWLAWWLTRLRPRARIVVVERDRFGLGASTRNAGFLTCGHISEYLDDLRSVPWSTVLASLQRRREGMALARAEFPRLVGPACGSIDHDPRCDEGLELAERFNTATSCEIYRPIDAALGSRRAPAIANLIDAGLDPFDYLVSLRAAAQSVPFVFGRRVDAIGDGRAQLGGQELRYEHAFVCTNGFANELVADADIEAARGQVIVTSPVRAGLPSGLGYLDRGYLYFRAVDGRLLIGGGRDRFRAIERSSRIETSPELRAYLRERAVDVLGHDAFEVEHHWSGIMGMPGGAHLGGDPVRAIDASTTLVAGFGGMGVAATPVVTRSVAEGS